MKKKKPNNLVSIKGTKPHSPKGHEHKHDGHGKCLDCGEEMEVTMRPATYWELDGFKTIASVCRNLELNCMNIMHKELKENGTEPSVYAILEVMFPQVLDMYRSQSEGTDGN